MHNILCVNNTFSELKLFLSSIKKPFLLPSVVNLQLLQAKPENLCSRESAAPAMLGITGTLIHTRSIFNRASSIAPEKPGYSL